jgi:site-specific DNA-cytosine methylase
MSKDSYAYIHPYEPRSISVREAARIQSFPDWFRFGSLGLVEAFKIIGNAVPPLLSYQLAERVAQVLQLASQSTEDKPGIGESVNHEAVS